MTSAVRLIGGREVASDSEDWRHECEARAIAALPTLAERRAWLHSLEARRGKNEADRIRATMGRLWKAKRAQQGSVQPEKVTCASIER